LVAPEEKLRRSQELSTLTAETGNAYVRQFVGRTMRVLVEGKHSKSGMLSGLTDNYIEVHFAGPSSLVREFCHVTICQVQDGLSYGELAPEPLASRTNLFAWA
jgi:tRNA A37 methylthiotransferase MiaB